MKRPPHHILRIPQVEVEALRLRADGVPFVGMGFYPANAVLKDGVALPDLIDPVAPILTDAVRRAVRDVA